MCVRSEQVRGGDVTAVFKSGRPAWTKLQGFGSLGHERRVSTTETSKPQSLCSSVISQLLLIIRETTQPCHVFAVVAVLVVSAVFFPTKGDATELEAKVRKLLGLLHLTAFAIHFGSQVWMTFVSGLSLYFTMPRHVFGQIQKVLFPLYFTLTGFLSLVTLFTYSHLHPTEANGSTQLAVMCACFVAQLFARLCLCPPLVRFMETKHKMESMAPPEEIAKCPQYMRYCLYFRRAHTATAVCNIFTMACTTFHLQYLAQQLCI